MQKKLSEITRAEWVALQWYEVPPTMGMDDRVFMAEARRTPDESAQAATDWDSTAEEREQLKDLDL